MKHILITIAAMVLVGCSTTQQLVSQSESRSVAFKARSRLLQDGKDIVKSVDVKWQAEKTAVVICDMWSRHWCDSASRRCAEMAPRINAFVSALRARGVLVIHCQAPA